MEGVLVGIVGEDKDCKEVLFKSFEYFMPKYIVLLIKKGENKKAERIFAECKRFNIKCESFEISNKNCLEEIFVKIREITNLYENFEIVINVDCDYLTSCLALSSAFVNGIPAIGILEEKIISYPIMKFSYYNSINEKKYLILKTLYENKKVFSLEELSRTTKMSLPLIAYHIRGNRDTEGLISMKLVEARKKEGRVSLELTQLGRLIVRGYIDTSYIGQ